MKKLLMISFVFAFLLLTACEAESGTAKRQGGTSSVSDVINAQIEASGKKAAPTETPAAALTETPTAALTETPTAAPTEAPDVPVGDTAGSRDVDVDLTELSSTMVYSEVFNMMNDPDFYMGKIIKMKGIFSVYHDDYTGIDYFYCIIKDATACCAQGMEFTLEGCSYPDDYPEEGMEIVVMGEYTTYLEGKTLYCTLKDATLLEAAFE